MGQRPKLYTREFTERAIRLCEEHPDRRIADIARELDVEYATLYSWMKRAGKTKRRGPANVRAPSAAQTPQTPQAMQAEIERLRRELEETKEKLEFAKKAAAFFAQHDE
jgi:transposase